ncbi:MFS transporter [Amycolatopsis sp. NPDC051128]|uniref:MFS transporter n=1 Tax=Amycolatopsis sp. NPDC051128 TaxID=3155412 RepID=UPI00342FAF3D
MSNIQTSPGPSPVAERSRGPMAAITAFAFWAVMVGTTVPTALYPLYKSQFAFGSLAVTILFAVYAVGVVAGLLLFGRVSDQVGRKPVVLTALLLAAAAAVVFLTAQGLPALLVGRVLSGFSAALVTGAATAGIMELFPLARKGSAPIVTLLSNMGGLACGNLIAGLLAATGAVPLRLPWIVHGGLLLIALVSLWFVPETVTATGKLKLTPQRLHVPREIRGVFLRSAMTGGAGFAVLGVLTAVAGILLGSVLHKTSPALTGFVVFLAFACTALGQLALRRMRPATALPAACLALILASALVALAVLAASLTALLLAAVATGFGTGAAIGCGMLAITTGAAPQLRGAAVSTFFAILYAMLSLPAVGVGVLIQLAGLRVAGTTFAIVVALIAAGVLLSLTSRKKAAE